MVILLSPYLVIQQCVANIIQYYLVPFKYYTGRRVVASTNEEHTDVSWSHFGGADYHSISNNFYEQRPQD
jgi:hypothetical protein